MGSLQKVKVIIMSSEEIYGNTFPLRSLTTMCLHTNTPHGERSEMAPYHEAPQRHSFILLTLNAIIVRGQSSHVQLGIKLKGLR